MGDSISSPLFHCEELGVPTRNLPLSEVVGAAAATVVVVVVVVAALVEVEVVWVVKVETEVQDVVDV